MIKLRHKILFSLACCLIFATTASGQSLSEQETLRYLKNLSIEDLLQTQITSVSKKPEALFSAAAAITVISQEEIKRSGARSLPEALRMVPGLSVANIDSSRYAIGSRGFNEYFETKLLVLMDGRSMYTPLFSGVHWNAMDTIMEDIERIEVIRGPGATIWGANAVNGVINIITKNSNDTQGGLVAVTGGSHAQPDISTRYGGELGETLAYRLYAKGYQRHPNESLQGDDAHDGSEAIRAGIRLDSKDTGNDIFSFQTEIYDGNWDVESMLSGYLSPPFVRATDETENYTGGHILATWKHSFTDGSTTLFQIYYDRAERDQVVAIEKRDTADLEFKHHWQLLDNHDIVWGGGVRWTSDDLEGTFTTSFEPTEDDLTLWNIFLQDDINLIDDTLWLTVGSKFEYNEYTDLEVQPSIRMRIKPTSKQLLWAAISHAVRTPSRSERDIRINLGTMPDGQNGLVSQQLLGSDSFASEELSAYELGYRWQATENLSLDIATYYNKYEELRSINSGAPFFATSPVPRLVVPAYFSNDIQGEAYGAEIQTTWQPSNRLKLTASYSYIELDLNYTDPARAERDISSEEFAPEHQFQLRSYYDLTSTLSIDSELYYVSDLGDNEIDSYVRFDIQMSWQANDNIRLTAGVENLFNSSHQEFFDTQSNIVASEVPTQYWLKATFTF